MTQKQWTLEEKLEIVLTGLRGNVSVSELCRKHGVNEATYYKWQSRFLEGGESG